MRVDGPRPGWRAAGPAGPRLRTPSAFSRVLADSIGERSGADGGGAGTWGHRHRRRPVRFRFEGLTLEGPSLHSAKGPWSCGPNGPPSSRHDNEFVPSPPRGSVSLTPLPPLA